MHKRDGAPGNKVVFIVYRKWITGNTYFVNRALLLFPLQCYLCNDPMFMV